MIRYHCYITRTVLKKKIPCVDFKNQSHFFRDFSIYEYLRAEPPLPGFSSFFFTIYERKQKQRMKKKKQKD